MRYAGKRIDNSNSRGRRMTDRQTVSQSVMDRRAVRTVEEGKGSGLGKRFAGRIQTDQPANDWMITHGLPFVRAGRLVGFQEYNVGTSAMVSPPIEGEARMPPLLLQIYGHYEELEAKYGQWTVPAIHLVKTEAGQKLPNYRSFAIVIPRLIVLADRVAFQKPRTSLGSSPPYQGGWPLTSVIPMEPASPTQIDPSLALALRSVTRAQLYMYVVSRLGVYQRSNHLPTGGVVVLTRVPSRYNATTITVAYTIRHAPNAKHDASKPPAHFSRATTKDG
ncbi:uncharacterized protein BO72DRAFT_508756 [Aspergillus fijiensis CBS 313.89]|uniref:Uncharacterized protein n=1 Tax=Aspergillus fijiensis CBS 313.89 TaxID=1448319 RepID=A0A8G1VZT6_9EURO|nr:uncharacterized protein BO72DRAFT_508756 [Aspergillus fijiensis CBS 313.89]RAK77883.1 hypothetical protein BO72DRAFT_508756 [Aspergillus fijiensis CBS 313.89]